MNESRLGLVIVAMTVGNAIILVSQTAVPLALPSIISELGVDSTSVQWVLTASLLPLAGFMVLGGRLGDLFGLRQVFTLGSLIFGAASLFAGIAPNFEMLIAARALQGVGGAMLLPTSVAIVSAVAGPSKAGRALGTLGGAAAVAGALGPIIGGALAGAFGWRGVMLVNLPLAAISVVGVLAFVRKDPPAKDRARVDIGGAVLLSLAIVGVVFGIGQSTSWGWSSPGVWGPIGLAVIAGVVFVLVERRVAVPLMDLTLLRRHRNYAGATISQALGGMVEMGLGVIFPLILILNLGMSPALAGLALLPTTLPMVIVAPLAGRWYDRVGGRVPLVVGFATLAVAGVALALGAFSHSLLALLPGLLLYGIGLAIVLTVNDPVSLDSVPPQSHGQASGVSATGEQFGGALGIAALYVAFHTTYVTQLERLISSSSLGALDDDQLQRLRNDLESAENTGLDPTTFDPSLAQYLQIAFDASALGYVVAFSAASLIALVGAVAASLLVRRAADPSVDMTTPESVFATAATVGSAGSTPTHRRRR